MPKAGLLGRLNEKPAVTHMNNSRGETTTDLPNEDGPNDEFRNALW